MRDQLAAIEMLLAPPHAVLLAVEAEVERGAEVEARFADRLDLDRARLAVEHVEVDHALLRPACTVVVDELRAHAADALLGAVGAVEITGEVEGTATAHLQIVVVLVASAVGALEHHRRPVE